MTTMEPKTFEPESCEEPSSGDSPPALGAFKLGFSLSHASCRRLKSTGCPNRGAFYASFSTMQPY
jgi:hypothetical protein